MELFVALSLLYLKLHRSWLINGRYIIYYTESNANHVLVVDNDQVEQSPTCFNCLQCLERLFIDSSVSCTSPQQCLPRMKNDVKLHKGKAAVNPLWLLLLPL